MEVLSLLFHKNNRVFLMNVKFYTILAMCSGPGRHPQANGGGQLPVFIKQIS